jgi:hypothetical protein
MNSSKDHHSEDAHFARPLKKGTPLPSWFGSVGFHIVTLVIVLIMMRMAPERKQAPGNDRTVDGGVAIYDGELVEQTQFTYEGEDTESSPSEAASSSEESAITMDSALNRTPSATAPSEMELPDTQAIGPSMLEQNVDGGVLQAISGPGATGPGETGTEVSFHGAGGNGSKFVYVIDRSGSMGGSAEAALRAAKQELTRSMEAIEETHQFQIVFFNQDAKAFNPAGERRLAFGTAHNKRIAQNFMATIIPDGGTEHEPALMMALSMKPDVIFFLSDAGIPQMTAAQLERIHRAAGTTTINAIEYGRGTRPVANNFLGRLASQNGGQHVYVDITPYIGRP